MGYVAARPMQKSYATPGSASKLLRAYAQTSRRHARLQRQGRARGALHTAASKRRRPGPTASVERGVYMPELFLAVVRKVVNEAARQGVGEQALGRLL